MFWPSRVRLSSLVPAILFLGACQSTPPPVPVEGSEASVRLLEGEWEGELMATGTEHVGSMSFTLTAGEKVASGDVILFPLRPADEANRQEEETAPPPPRILPINFVRCVAGTVLGTVGPYHDPTCDCMVTTEFQGVVEGDRITGRFTTWREESTVPVKGRWTMRRKGA